MTKLYRHYKNKPYRYLGDVRHSETLETLALYETRYPNDLGTLWVRPKEMFFEAVEIDGIKRPRFEKLTFEFGETNALTSELREEVLALLDRVFGGYSRGKLDGTLANRGEIHFVGARFEGKLIGFKLGYTYNDERFYSWLGAVLPEYRGGGIASELMRRQHDWCRTRGFKVVETRTKNKWKEMLLLNIKSGFEIVGTYTNAKGEAKIVLEKRL